MLVGSLGGGSLTGISARTRRDLASWSADLMEQTLNGYLAALEALFCNPNDEAARAWWTSEGYAAPAHPVVPLATIHRARLQWLDATDDMLSESRAFLFDYGYEGINIRAYTTKTRDAARAKLGLPPLKGTS
jgi:hypothetical protein